MQNTFLQRRTLDMIPGLALSLLISTLLLQGAPAQENRPQERPYISGYIKGGFKGEASPSTAQSALRVILVQEEKREFSSGGAQAYITITVATNIFRVDREGVWTAGRLEDVQAGRRTDVWVDERRVMGTYPVRATAQTIAVFPSVTEKPADSDPASPPASPRPPSAGERPSDEPIRIGGKILADRLLHHVDPVYPQAALESRIQGVVLLQSGIDATGAVEGLRFMRGHPLLNQAAIEAVSQWRYQPVLLNGRPVRVLATVVVEFKLPDQNQ